MTHSQAIETMIRQAEGLLARGERRAAAVLLDKVLRLDFTNPTVWHLLHEMLGEGQPFEQFQKAFAQKNYPSRAHLLEPPASPTTIAVQPAQDQACPACGALNRPESRFCGDCGAPLMLPDEPVPPLPNPPRLAAQPEALEPREPALQPPAVIQPPAVVQPPAWQSPSAGAPGILCSNCGRYNLQDARLCAYCGYDFYTHQPGKPAAISKEKPRLVFHFVDLGDFVMLASLLLPWASIFRNTFLGNKTTLYDGFQVMAQFTGGGNINVAVILFFLLGLGASILVRARQKVLAIIAAVGSLAAQIYALTTLQSISGQASGSAGMFFDLSSVKVREGAIVGLVGAVLVLLGVVFFEGGVIGTLGRFVKRAWKVLLVLLVALGLIAAVILVPPYVESSNRARMTSIPREKTGTAQSIQQQLKALTATEAVYQRNRTNFARTAEQSQQENLNRTSTVAALTQRPTATPPRLAATPSPKPITPAPGGGADLRQYAIVFVSTRSGKPEIFTAGADGANLRQLTNNDLDEDQPHWSNDRRMIAFQAKSGGQNDIYVMDSDGKNLRRLTQGAEQDFDIAWSADSRSLVFVKEKPYGNLYRVDVTSGETVQLTDDKNYKYNVDWSPDGKTILYTANCSGGWCIFAADANGKNPRALTEGSAGPAWAADWSPDGSKIAFNLGGNKTSNIWIMNQDGSGKRQITSGGVDYQSPSWSPDGQWIAFWGTVSGKKTILFARPDGSELRKFDLDGNSYRPNFAP